MALGPYSCSLYDTIEQVDAREWSAICGSAADDVFMDVGFIGCVQDTMASQAKFWYAIVRDAAGGPVACACLSKFTADPLLIAGEYLRRASRYFRAIFPHLLYFDIMMCGLPVSNGHSAVRFSPCANHSLAAEQLDQVLEQLACREGAHFIVHKEFDETGCRQMESLLRRGYILAESLPMNSFAARFSSFDDYAGALKAHYRQDIVRSGIKLKNSGCTIARLSGGETLEGLYTEDVHRLYYAVVERAVNKLEILPREFFLKLVRQFPDSVSFTYIRRENAIAAFNWAIRTERSYHLLFCGLDYALNAEADLYFNLMYAELNHALRSNAVRIEVGQTADTFKARLGCTQAPLWFYIKARTAPFVFRLFARFLFPSRDRIRPYDIYKSGKRR